MDTSNPVDLIKLIQSGGSVGIAMLVWIAFQIRSAVKEYVTKVNETLIALSNNVTQLKETTAKLESNQEKLEEELQELKRITTTPLRIGNG